MSEARPQRSRHELPLGSRVKRSALNTPSATERQGATGSHSGPSVHTPGMMSDILSDYTFRVGRSDDGKGYLATVDEFDHLSATGMMPEEALDELHRMVDDYINHIKTPMRPRVEPDTSTPAPLDEELVGTPPTVSWDEVRAKRPVDEDFAHVLFERYTTTDDAALTWRERASQSYRRLFERNSPNLQEQSARRRGMYITGGVWMAAAALGAGIVMAQGSINSEVVTTDAFEPIVESGALVTYGSPVATSEVSRGDKVRVVRADGVVEYGLFDATGLNDTVTLFSPAADDRSLVAPREVALVSRSLNGVGRFHGVLTSPFLAILPLALTGLGFWGRTRRRVRAEQHTDTLTGA